MEVRKTVVGYDTEVLTKGSLAQVVKRQGPSWYRTIKSVSMALCEDGMGRTAYTVNGEPDTFFSTPAYVYVWDSENKRNVRVSGYLGQDSDGIFTFNAYLYRRNARYIVPLDECRKAYDKYASSFNYNPYEVAPVRH